MRQSWQEYFFSILDTVSNRSTCDRGKCGCLIVDSQNTIISTGYVGSLPGFEHCDDVGHDMRQSIHSSGKITEHCVRTIHAEQNAIAQAARSGRQLQNSILYSTICPCKTCAQLLISSGIKEVYFKKIYSDISGLLLMLRSKLEVYDWDEEYSVKTPIHKIFSSYLYDSELLESQLFGFYSGKQDKGHLE